MRPQILVLLVMSSSLLAPACPPSPQPPQPTDLDAGVDEGRRPPASDASTSAVLACANLAAVGCKEGAAPDCAIVIDRAVSTRVAPVDVVCLATKKTKTGLRACGFVACP